jgi:hypothetical protein
MVFMLFSSECFIFFPLSIIAIKIHSGIPQTAQNHPCFHDRAMESIIFFSRQRKPALDIR